MYKDTIKVANKIISDTDLFEIFQKMNDELKENIRISNQEKIENEKFESNYQHWTLKNFEGTIKVDIDFYDDTHIRVDNYNSFITIFNSRLKDIKNLIVMYHYNYWIQNEKDSNYISQSLTMNIYEDKMNIDVNLSSADNKMNDIYDLIKAKIQNSPVKYDRIIKNKTSITNKIGLSIGMIPSAIICVLLLLVPTIREYYEKTYILFPILTLFLSLVIGNTIINGRMDKLYSPLVPEKKYAGYDSSSGKSMYKDDIDKFVNSSEIIIGKNIDNINNRKEIQEMEKKYSKFIPIELISLLVLSIIVIIVCKLI